MHEIQIKIYKFLEEIKQTEYKIPEKLLAKFGEETQAALKKQFERKPRDFKLSMSNVGKPLCILQMERELGFRADIYDTNKFLFGDLVEAHLMFLIYASGLEVLAEQKHTKLSIGEYTVNGTLDLILAINGQPKVYDVKSTSDYSFKDKMNNSYVDFMEKDTFGYHTQLFGYAKAEGIQAGGFILENKSTGEIGVLEPPEDNYQELEDIALAQIEFNLMNYNSPFKRRFNDELEYFKKKPTGNRILGKNCGFCSFKFECWPSLQVKAQAKSTAKNPRMVLYTEYNE